jgi:hypothetical protein
MPKLLYEVIKQFGDEIQTEILKKTIVRNAS